MRGVVDAECRSHTGDWSIRLSAGLLDEGVDQYLVAVRYEPISIDGGVSARDARFAGLRQSLADDGLYVRSRRSLRDDSCGLDARDELIDVV